jgi:hypothetical protein
MRAATPVIGPWLTVALPIAAACAANATVTVDLHGSTTDAGMQGMPRRLIRFRQKLGR